MRNCPVLLAFLLLVGANAATTPSRAESPAAPAPPAVSAPLPEDLRTKLEGVMQAKAAALLNEKNADGATYKRGSYSRNFKKVDDSTYQVTFHQDTASADSLLTERYLVTLKKDGSGRWAVANQELQDSYTGLYRGLFSSSDVAGFQSFDLSREGMKIRAGKGSLHKRYFQGKVSRLIVGAPDLSYEYNPTDKLASVLYDKLKKERNTDVVFKPDHVAIYCDPLTCEEILATAFKGLPATAEKGIAPETLARIDPGLKKKIEDDVKEYKKNIRENGFWGFDRPHEPGRRAYFIDIKKDSPQREVGISYDSNEPKEVFYYAYNLDKEFAFIQPVYAYYSQATRDAIDKGTLSKYDLEKRDDSNAREYDLTGLKGTAEMGIEDSETLVGDFTFSMTTKKKLREVLFFIDRLRETPDEKKQAKNPSMQINTIEDGAGHPLTWVKLGATSGLVVLPEEVPAGTPLTLRMQFKANDVIYHSSPTFSYVSRFGWVPFIRFTDMIKDFDLTVKVPARYKTLGVGRKTEDRVENGIGITRWVGDSPVSFPSIIFGEYQETQSTVEVLKTDGTKVPVWIHVDKLGKISWAEKHMQDLVDQAANSLNLYTKIYGVDYPYAKLDLVNDPRPAFYGQAPSSLIYLGNYVFLGENAGALFDSGYISKFNREVVPHEVGHQWWGSLIGNYNTSNYWFVESLAEYSSALYVEFSEGAEGRKRYGEKVAEWRKEILDADLWCSVQDASIIWSGDLFRGYRAAVYAKGPYMFHIMRQTWGEEKFFAYLKMLAQDLKNTSIVTRDIQRVAEKAFGGNMEFFFDQWIRGVGLPEYTITYKVRPTEDGKFLIEGQVDQRLLFGKKKEVLEGQTFRAVVPITIVGKDGKEGQHRLLVEGASKAFQFKVNERPKEIIFNKYGESLAYNVIVKNIS